MRKYNKPGSCQKVEVGARASDVQWVMPSKQASTRPASKQESKKDEKDQDRDQDQDQALAADGRRQGVELDFAKFFFAMFAVCLCVW